MTAPCNHPISPSVDADQAPSAQFGKIVTADNDGADSSERNPYYKAVYDAVQASIRAGGPAKGALFWEWVVRSDGEVLDVAWPDGRHPYGVSANDTTFMCALPA